VVRTRADPASFGDALLSAAESVSSSLRALVPPSGMPPLREMQSAMCGLPDGTSGVLFSATDEFTDAFNTAADALRRNLG
jgi:hypothetical protein